MIDIDQARNERTQTIGVVLPLSIVSAIEGLAKAELIARSSWLRRVILKELNRNTSVTHKASAPEAA
ncbi:NADH:ubiquinone oxidoreductase subunit D [Nitrobacteraceae bacterium AZCC 1564]